MAMSICGQEVKFVTMLLDEIVEETRLPSIIREDNTGALFLVNNPQVGQRTKHIDTRYHFVRDMIQRGEVQAVYVRSENNHADLCTKNLNKTLFDKHSGKIIGGDLGSVAREDVKFVECAVAPSQGPASESRPEGSRDDEQDWKTVSKRKGKTRNIGPEVKGRPGG
jgi:hypothetical protein